MFDIFDKEKNLLDKVGLYLNLKKLQTTSIRHICINCVKVLQILPQKNPNQENLLKNGTKHENGMIENSKNAPSKDESEKQMKIFKCMKCHRTYSIKGKFKRHKCAICSICKKYLKQCKN
ncbi:hypothetical protein PVAND_000020 [Polypedilum vanderplanki]|uniref:Uncharacterized protein n=1 Tax=Polypedilum vanderplanki TaxID=319348 RepID=A0A9J6BIT0_POLVA|nr:hypothetical protein PVAND_000020 [Polypedilum vanderplanki]